MTTPNMNKAMSEIFDIELTQTDKSVEELKMDAKADNIDSLEKQREYVKGNIIKLIEKGNIALDNLDSIAKSSESFKDFAVLNDLLKTLVASNISLLECEVSHKPPALPPTTKDGQKAEQITNNTAVFVGSTTDLANYIKNVSLNGIPVPKD